MNNPMQQIERTMDAYAGNPEGLQKRANMSKELIDLLAMQKMQTDMEAAKRNMAMQQQGNPQTVKDQLEEGLMGQYRQEAAKDLGVGPSEGDVVERAGIAGQQMAQNAQMPQGPQGPQGGGGGIASQAGPVKLAGGGIVAFDNGSDGKGPVEAEETVSYADLASEFGSDVGNWIVENPVDAALIGVSLIPVIGQVAGAAGRGALGAYRIGKKGYDMLKANPTAQRLATKAKDLAVRAVTKSVPNKNLKLGDMKTVGDATTRVYDPRKGAAIGGATIGGITAKNLLSDDEEEIEKTGIAGQPPAASSAGSSVDDVDIPFDVNAGLTLPPSMAPSQPIKPGGGVLAPREKPGGGVMMTPEMVKAKEAEKADAPTSATGDPYLDALLKRTAEPRPAYEPPARSTELTGILSKLASTQRDPDTEARRIRDLYREEESRGINTSRLQELRSKYDKQEEQLSDPFNRFIGIASRQGKEGIAAAGQEYLAQDAGIRGLEDTYQGERDVIRQEQVTLNNTLGEKAVAAYNKTLDRNSQNDRQLATAFSTLNERDQENARNAFEDAVKGDDKLDGILLKLSDVRRRAIEDTTMTAGEAATASGQLTSSIESMQAQLQNFENIYLQRAIPLELYTRYASNPLGLDEDERKQIAEAQSNALLDPEYVKQVAKLKKAITAAEETRSALINKAGGDDVPSNDAAVDDIKAALGI